MGYIDYRIGASSARFSPSVTAAPSPGSQAVTEEVNAFSKPVDRRIVLRVVGPLCWRRKRPEHIGPEQHLVPPVHRRRVTYRSVRTADHHLPPRFPSHGPGDALVAVRVGAGVPDAHAFHSGSGRSWRPALGASLDMAARIGTLPGHRRTATSPSARLLP